MTLVHWFQSSTPHEQIVSTVKTVVSGQAPLQLVVEKEDLFGENKDVLVNRVSRTDELLQLHNKLVWSLEEIGVVHTNNDWVGDGWNPHVTHKAKSKLLPNDTFIVDSVSIVCSDDFKHGQRKLLATISLS